MRKALATTTHAVTVYSRDDNGNRFEETLTGQLTLYIDVDELFKHMGLAALRSKGKRSRIAGGRVEVVAEKRTIVRKARANA